MEGRGAGLAGAEPHEGAGEFFQVGGEVFSAHGWELGQSDVLFAQVGGSDFFQEINFLRCIDGGAMAADVVQLRVGAKHEVQACQDFSQSLFHLVAEGRGVGADGAFEVCIFDADVVAGAGIHEADGADYIFHGVHLAGDQGLHVDDEVGSSHEGIGAVVGLRCVGGFPFHMDVEAVGGSHEVAGLQAHHADGELGPYMKAVDFRNVVQLAALRDVAAAADGCFFFGRLEDQLHGAFEFVLHLVQHGSGAEEDGHVAVVSAGMHLAGVLRSEGKAGLFGHRQRVHVCAKSHGLAGRIAVDVADDGVLEEPGLKRDAQLCEFILDVERGIHFLAGHFRVGVEMAAPGDDLWNHGVDFFFDFFFKHLHCPLFMEAGL